MLRGGASLLLILLGTSAALASPVPLQSVHAPVQVAASVQTALAAQVATLEKKIQGKIGVAIRLLETGESASVNGAELYPMASTYKVAIAGTILARVDRGEVKLDQMISVTQRDMDETGDIADHVMHPGVSLSVANLMELMLTQSNNNATDRMFALAGGPAAVMAFLKQHKIEGMRIDRTVNELLNSYAHFPTGTPFTKEYKTRWPTEAEQKAADAAGHADWYADPRDTTVPMAMVELLSKLLASPLLKEDSRAFLQGVMERCETGQARLRGLLPAETVVAHKTGTVGETVNDVGMITLPEGRGHLLIAVYTKGSSLPYADREHAIAEISRTAFDYFTMR